MMKMKLNLKRIGVVWAVCLAILSAGTAGAATDVGFQTRVTTGLEDYTLHYDQSYRVMLPFTISDSVPFIGMGTSFFYKNFYADLYYQHSADGNHSICEGKYITPAQYPWAGLITNADVNINGNAEFYLRDFSVTAGYRITDNFSGYAGYKLSESIMDLDLHSSFQMVDDGSITGIPGFPMSVIYHGELGCTYRSKGPFVGGAYGIVLGDKGMLSLNLSLAFLEGKIRQSGNYANVQTGLNEIDYMLSSSGDCIGISYGAAWQSSITEKVGYSFGVKGYKYDFESKDVERSDFQETVFSYHANVTYSF
jgi:hypothetical protein